MKDNNLVVELKSELKHRLCQDYVPIWCGVTSLSKFESILHDRHIPYETYIIHNSIQNYHLYYISRKSVYQIGELQGYRGQFTALICYQGTTFHCLNAQNKAQKDHSYMIDHIIIPQFGELSPKTDFINQNTNTRVSQSVHEFSLFLKNKFKEQQVPIVCLQNQKSIIIDICNKQKINTHTIRFIDHDNNDIVNILIFIKRSQVHHLPNLEAFNVQTTFYIEYQYSKFVGINFEENDELNIILFTRLFGKVHGLENLQIANLTLNDITSKEITITPNLAEIETKIPELSPISIAPESISPVTIPPLPTLKKKQHKPKQIHKLPDSVQQEIVKQKELVKQTNSTELIMLKSRVQVDADVEQSAIILKERHEKRKATKTKSLRSRSNTSEYDRNSAVKRYAEQRAMGKCELCDQPRFLGKNGDFSYDVHHVDELGELGEDEIWNVGAICGECHKRIHDGLDGDEWNELLRRKILQKEKDLGHEFIK